LHTEIDAESNANTKTQFGSQAVLWQLKKLHIPKREKKRLPRAELLAEQKCNQLQPEANAETKSGAYASPAGCC
jgi:hypothetical protein